MATPPIIIDQYAPLSHHAGLAPDITPPWRPWPWVPTHAARRLQVYRILAGYLENVSRFNLTRLPEAKRAEQREYGDPRLLVDRIVAGLLGSGVAPTVTGAASPPPSTPELPAEPAEPADDATDLARQVHTVRSAVYADQVTTVLDRWSTDWAAYPSLRARQDWLDEWWEVESVAAKLHESEEGTVALGDGVLTVSWSPDKARPIVTVYEPDCYFPVLPDEPTDFVDTVHLAWEFEDDDHKLWLRRLTYRLTDLDPDGPVLPVLPWRTGPSTRRCFLTDKVWPLNATASTASSGWANLDETLGQVQTNSDGDPLDDFDLGIDFLPVIHIPNTPSSKAHFGRSSLLAVAQLIDDIAATDTDTQRAAAIAGTPIIGASGVSVAQGVVVEAGAVIDGTLSVLDASAPLTALLDLGDRLRDLLAVLSQVPGVVQGRVSGQDVPSGVALALSFIPFEQLAAVLRLTRSQKYPLLPKFALRFAQLAGDVPAGPDVPVTVSFESTIPTDIDAVVTRVARLLEHEAVSHETAVLMLSMAGLPVDAAERELARIRSQNTAAAKDIADATGSEALAAEYLGLELPDRPVGPDIAAGPLPGPLG